MYILEDLILPKNLKIKAIRKYLKINQQDLVGDKIDRSLISYVENGKTKLTRSTANVIALNLRRIIEEKNLDLKVSAEYIFADESKQAEYLLDTYIEKLNRLKDSDDEGFRNELAKAEDLLNEWDTASRKAKIYEIAGDYYYEKLSSEKSKIYYLKSLENYSRLSDYYNMADINSKLARCALKKHNYEEASYINMHVLYMFGKNNIVNPILEKRVLFNNALANAKLKRYEISMEMIDRLKTKLGDDERTEYIDVLMLQANIHVEKCEYQKALEAYEQILSVSKKIGNREFEAMANNNLGYIYSLLDDFDKSIYYYTESLHIREEINSRYIILTLVSLAERYLRNNEYDQGKEYLLRVIQMLKSEKDMSIKYKVYDNLIDIYLNSYGIKMDSSICNDIFEFVKQYRKELEDQELIIKLCKYYAKHDLKKVKEIIDIAL